MRVDEFLNFNFFTSSKNSLLRRVVNYNEIIIEKRVEVWENVTGPGATGACFHNISRSPRPHDICIHKCTSVCQLKPHFDIIFACITATRDFFL